MQSTLLRASRRRCLDIRMKLSQCTWCLDVQLVVALCPMLSTFPWRTSSKRKPPPALQSPQASRQSSSSCLRLYPASISHNNRVLRHYSAASLGPLVGDRVLRIVNVALRIFSITSCRVDDPCYTTSRLHRGLSNIAKDIPYCRDWKNETTRSFENQRADNAKRIVGNASRN